MRHYSLGIKGLDVIGGFSIFQAEKGTGHFLRTLIIFHPFLAYIDKEFVCEEYRSLSSAIHEFEGIAKIDEFGIAGTTVLDDDLHFKIHTKLGILERS